MRSEAEKERLRLKVERAGEVVHDCLALEQILFEDRFNDAFGENIEHFVRWKAQHQKFLTALRDWKAALDAYTAATKSD